MAFSISRKKGVNVFRVVGKLIGTLIALWAGGVIFSAVGSVMNGTESPFYTGLSLIGWTVGDYAMFNTSHRAIDCASTAYDINNGTGQNCITNTGGSGILAVIGIIGIASVVLEFVDIKM